MNFDHYANVDEDAECLKIVQEKKYYNPNSNHWLSVDTNETFELANRIVQSIFPMYKTIEFVPSGGTGANIRAILENQVIRNIAIPEKNDIIMISAIEHSSILKKVVYNLNVKSYTIIIFPVDKNGIIDLVKFKQLFDEFMNRIILVSCIMTNNEIGTIQPIDELIQIVKNTKRNIIFHSDCACNLPQILKYKILPDIITFSCYKFHGPHTGILLSNIKMTQDTFGTPDVKNFYFASLALKKYFDSHDITSVLHHQFKMNLKQLLYSTMYDNNINFVNFDTHLSANNVLTFAITGIKTSLIQKELSKSFIAIGSGSACTTNEGSHTVKALGYSEELSQQLVRLSFNYTDQTIIPSFVSSFVNIVNSLKYIRKHTDITQKSPTFNVIRPSIRKAVDIADIIMYDIDKLPKPNNTMIQLSSGEQALKGRNKSKFNDILTNNIKITMKKKFCDVSYKLKSHEDFHTLCLDSSSTVPHNVEELYDVLSKLPGVSVISPCENVILPTCENISQVVTAHFNEAYQTSLTFSVRVKISGKTLEGKTNKDWEYYLGKTIQENFLATVDLNNPDIIIYVKGYNDCIFVGTRKIQGVGGLPSGSEGKIIFFVDKTNCSSSSDSILKMYIRGTIPIVFTNDLHTYHYMQLFLDEKCTKYELIFVNDHTELMTSLKTFDNIRHIVYETNFKNIYVMKQFGKLYGKYVFSNNMFDNPDLKSDNFFIEENNEVKLEKCTGLMLISGGFDSPIASHILSNNGFNHNYVHFIGNIDDTIGFNKIISLVTQLKQTNSTIYFVDFGKLQSEVAKKCPESYRVMMYKIYMVLIANNICKVNEYQFIAMGNSLGQVASQTPQNLYVTDYYSEVPILSPLVGINKTKIIEYAGKVGTKEISECNGNDCCVQYLPKNPVLNASIEEIQKLLNKIGDYNNFVTIQPHTLN